MQTRENRRRHLEHYVTRRHLKLDDLIKEAKDVYLFNKYLYKDYIPASPKPEFHVFHLKHKTTGEALEGIRRKQGFHSSHPGQVPLVWWSLAVGPEEVRSAESRLLKETFQNQTEEQRQQHESFLWRFTTSPAFLETSRLGSYCLTFPLEEVMKAYSEQFCSGAPPTMRIYETVLYKQEVLHSVLVHSPSTQDFSDYPLLTDDPNAVCVYRDGRFIWRPEAMCGTHSNELIINEEAMQMETAFIFAYRAQFYVWDNIAVAFHVEDRQKVLHLGADRLRQNLKYCQRERQGMGKDEDFEPFDEAEIRVRRLWPDVDNPLEETCSLEQSFTEGPPEPALSSTQ